MINNIESDINLPESDVDLFESNVDLFESNVDLPEYTFIPIDVNLDKLIESLQ
jgi:hypothetical protein